MAMGRTSIRTPAKSGFHQTVSGEVFGQGISEGRPLRRVSIHDQQTLPLRLAAMRDYVSKRGWKTALEIQDVGSSASLRPQREELLKAARRRELDQIVVWRPDPGDGRSSILSSR